MNPVIRTSKREFTEECTSMGDGQVGQELIQGKVTGGLDG
jgi:hypothetical protein